MCLSILVIFREIRIELFIQSRAIDHSLSTDYRSKVLVRQFGDIEISGLGSAYLDCNNCVVWNMNRTKYPYTWTPEWENSNPVNQTRNLILSSQNGTDRQLLKAGEHNNRNVVVTARKTANINNLIIVDIIVYVLICYKSEPVP